MPSTTTAVAELIRQGAGAYVLTLGVGLCEECFQVSEVKTLKRDDSGKLRCKCGGEVTEMKAA